MSVSLPHHWKHWTSYLNVCHITKIMNIKNWKPDYKRFCSFWVTNLQSGGLANFCPLFCLGFCSVFLLRAALPAHSWFAPPLVCQGHIRQSFVKFNSYSEQPEGPVTPSCREKQKQVHDFLSIPFLSLPISPLPTPHLLALPPFLRALSRSSSHHSTPSTPAQTGRSKKVNAAKPALFLLYGAAVKHCHGRVRPRGPRRCSEAAGAGTVRVARRSGSFRLTGAGGGLSGERSRSCVFPWKT